MNFSKKRPVKIVMLGAGGTGAHIAPHLYRLLYALERPVKFIICDGDKVEPKNLVRQNFTEADLGENKARVIAERYSDVFGLETSYIPRFIEDAGQLEELLRPEVFRHYVYGSEPNTGRWVTNSELVILIGAVDNNKSRKLCHEVFLRARDLVYIDSGNGEYTGQIVCGIRRAGKTVYKPVGMLYPEVSTPEDLFPTEVSCAEASVSAPQTIVANLMAATAVVTMIYNILVIGCNTVLENYVDSMQAVKIGRGHFFFVPRDFAARLQVFEDFVEMLEEHNQLKRPDRDPLEVNSIYVVDDAKQRKKMTAAFYRSVRREIAEYEERVTHLIQSGSQSPKIMDRWVMRIQGLEEKKRNYENTLCSDDHPGVRRSSGGYENPRLSSVGTYGPAAPIEYAGICNRAYGIPLSKNCG